MARLFGLASPPPAREPRRAYDLWADSYPPAAHNPLMEAEEDAVGRMLESVRATSALDLGTGSGRYLPRLAATGASRVIGLDASLGMLARCEPGVRRVCADACRLPFRAATFDLINASLMVGDVARLPEWAAEVARVLAPGGHLVYSDFHPSWAANGWRRSFQTADGRTVDVPYAAHTLDDHAVAMRHARLSVIETREPRLPSGAVSVTFWRRWGNPPVAVVVHAVKAT